MSRVDWLLLALVVGLAWYGFKFVLVQSEALYMVYTYQDKAQQIEKILEGVK